MRIQFDIVLDGSPLYTSVDEYRSVDITTKDREYLIKRLEALDSCPICGYQDPHRDVRCPNCGFNNWE